MKKLIAGIVVSFIAVMVPLSYAGAATPTPTWKVWYQTTGTTRVKLFLKDAKAIKVAEKIGDSNKLHRSCKKLRTDSNPYGALNKHAYFPGNTILDTEWIDAVSKFNVASGFCSDNDTWFLNKYLNQAMKRTINLTNQMQ